MFPSQDPEWNRMYSLCQLPGRGITRFLAAPAWQIIWVASRDGRPQQQQLPFSQRCREGGVRRSRMCHPVTSCDFSCGCCFLLGVRVRERELAPAALDMHSPWDEQSTHQGEDLFLFTEIRWFTQKQVAPGDLDEFEHKEGGKEDREETQDLKQAPGCPTWGLNLQTVRS
ncbi:uncharacterized protein LOC144229229 isoform X2 [Crocuta crocuta]